LMAGCGEGSWFYKAMWFLTDLSESTFFTSPLVSVIMCVT
jgi:hypothetical protein